MGIRLFDIIRGIRFKIRHPKARKKQMPLLTWEQFDPEGENAKQELLQDIEGDIREQLEALQEALRSQN